MKHTTKSIERQKTTPKFNVEKPESEKNYIHVNVATKYALENCS